MSAAAMGSFTVVRAAAGCGKTTDLARRYLSLLADGVPVDQAIAITFTRRAAAELQERVSLALRACLDDSSAARAARERLGTAWPLYAECAPSDPADVRDALAHLPDAPIGTTDAFIQRLLSEFALDVVLPLPGEHAVALDVPITPGAGPERALDRAARRILDPPDGQLDPDVQLLLRYFTLDDVLRQITWRSALDDLPLARSEEVLGLLARDLATALSGLDLRELLSPTDATDVDAWVAAMDRCTAAAGKWAMPAVAQWLVDGADPQSAPYALAGWLYGLHGGRKPYKAIRPLLHDKTRNLGIGIVTLAEVVDSLRYPYERPDHVRLADEVRAARDRLRERTRVEGLEQAALAGDLGYEDLIEAAIALCEDPPDRLRTRFGALLVDEVQDANPAQLRLYRALAALGSDDEPVRAYFVGDARQSIYLFRDAEPRGLVDLERITADRGQEPVDLVTNHRSAPELVKAHHSLFSALAEPMRRQRWSPPAPLDKVTAAPGSDDLALDPVRHRPDDPVWIVTADSIKPDEADRRALHAFLQRVQAAWSEDGHEADTAVVLARTWSSAREACRRLRRWSGDPDIAFVDSGAGWSGGRVATDLSQWLRALLDPSDQVAWLSVWKHPSVGLSDAALARVRAGVGVQIDGDDGPEPAPPWCHHLGRLIEADALVDPHDGSDQHVFAEVRQALHDARDAIGRGPTADWLDPLVTALDWRTVLAAGPGGLDDVARLEVLLDWIRTLDEDGIAPDALLTTLADPSGRADAPHVHLDRPGQHITCTTVFQAKGLAWDHVCMLQPGVVRGGRVSDTGASWLELDGRRMRVEGLRFDPYGGITPDHDPLGRLGVATQQLRYAEESARIAYVAITRARRSVTLGLAPYVAPRGKKKDQSPTDITGILQQVWLDPERELPGVARVERDEPPDAGPGKTGWARPAADDAWQRPILSEPAWDERAPSSFGAHLGTEGRAQVAEGVAARVRLMNGLHTGGPDLPPPGIDLHTGLGLPDHALGHLSPADWGTLAHGWFAVWRFAGEPAPAAVDAYLTDEWGAAPSEVRDWLLAISARLAEVGGPLWALVTAPDATLHFELPFVGLGGRSHDVVLSGRIDLLVQRARRWTVIDFKAGGKAPTGFDDLVEAASLRTYGPQLEAYGDALRAMGHTLDAVGLWFVRTGTSVRWLP